MFVELIEELTKLLFCQNILIGFLKDQMKQI